MQTLEAIEQDQKERAEPRERGIVPAKRRSIALLTPTLGAVSMWFTTALLDLLWPMNMGKGVIPVQDTQGGEIGEMRNRLVKMALDFEKSQENFELEAVLWVDDDVIVSRLALLTLAAHDRDIASGVYFAKGEAGNEPLIFAGPSSGTMKFKPGETFEAWGYAQGLSLVRTSVYRRMMDELDLGEDKYGNPCFYKQPSFGMDESGGITLGGTEDFFFFDNASKLGIRPLVDCTKHAFGWHYDLKEKTAYPRKQWDQYVRRQPVVWETPAGEVIWP